MSGDKSENIILRFEKGLKMTEIIEDMSTEILLENYIIHYLFHNVLLLKKDFSMSQLGELLIRVTFLRTIWIGLSYEKDQLPLKDIGESVQIISKAYEHRPELKNSSNH